MSRELQTAFLALQQERPEVLVHLSILVIILTEISVPTYGSFRPHTPSSTATAYANKIKAAQFICVFMWGGFGLDFLPVLTNLETFRCQILLSEAFLI